MATRESKVRQDLYSRPRNELGALRHRPQYRSTRRAFGSNFPEPGWLATPKDKP